MANGSLYGYINHEWAASLNVQEVNIETRMNMVTESAAEHTRQVDALIAELVTPTTEYKINHRLPGDGTLQPVDEDGNPLPVRPSGEYEVAFPIKGGGTAWGTNRVSRTELRVSDEQMMTADAMTRDANWMRTRILAAIFTNVAYNYKDKKHGTLSVQPMANNDGVIYTRRSGSASTDNHFYAQANAIGTGADNPFPTLYAELNEHPSNAGPYVAYVATNLVDDIENHPSLIPPGAAGVIYGTEVTRLLVDVDQNLPRNSEFANFGETYIGRINNIDVVGWSVLPDNYGFVVARGASETPLAMRRYPSPSLQGFVPEFHDVDGNHFETRFLRFAGFGALNRVAALAFRIGNASYAIPAGYNAAELP